MTQMRGVETGLHRVMRRLHNIERRIGTPFTEPVEVARQALAGAGPFCYDYLVDIEWGGAAGKEFTTLSGHTFKVYSTIQSAVTDAESRQNSGDIAHDVSIAICPGFYSENIVLGGNPVAGSQNGMYIVGLAMAPTRGVTHATGAVSLGISNTLGPGIDIQGTLPLYVLENLNVSVTTGGTALKGAASNTEAICRNIRFDDKVSGDFAGAYFIDCEFLGAGYSVDSGDTPASVVFDHCRFSQVSQSAWVGGASQHRFVGCQFIGSTGNGFNVTGGNNDDIGFYDCDIGTTGTLAEFFDITGVSTTMGRLLFSGCNFQPPGVANGLIHVGSGGAILRNLVVVGNTFEKSNGVTHPYIRSDADAGDCSNCIILGNAFGFDGIVDVYIETEDPTKASVIGNFDESVFGPNAPATIVQYDITGSNNEFYPGESAIGGSTSLRISRYQSATFAIDSTGVKTITTAHGLSTTPNIEDIQLTVHEETDVDDWGFDLLKVDSVDATNVVAKVNVSTASATGAATARLGILIVTG